MNYEKSKIKYQKKKRKKFFLNKESWNEQSCNFLFSMIFPLPSNEHGKNTKEIVIASQTVASDDLRL